MAPPAAGAREAAGRALGGALASRAIGPGRDQPLGDPEHATKPQAQRTSFTGPAVAIDPVRGVRPTEKRPIAARVCRISTKNYSQELISALRPRL